MKDLFTTYLLVGYLVASRLTYSVHIQQMIFNPYSANVENMVSSY